MIPWLALNRKMIKLWMSFNFKCIYVFMYILIILVNISDESKNHAKCFFIIKCVLMFPVGIKQTKVNAHLKLT